MADNTGQDLEDSSLPSRALQYRSSQITITPETGSKVNGWRRRKFGDLKKRKKHLNSN